MRLMFNSKKLAAENERLKQQLALSAAEKQKLLSRLKDYENQNRNLNDKVNQLSQRNDELLTKVQSLTKKAERFSDVDSAKKYSKNLRDKALSLYKEQLEILAVFIKRWQDALPDSDEITPGAKKRAALAKAIMRILADSPTDTIENCENSISRINATISGKPTNDEGTFNLDEVLNPGKLDLEQLCKELGVMD